MAQNKEQLDRLLGVIEQLANEAGNEEFKNKLHNKFGKEIKIISSDSEGLITEIHDFCIRTILNKQATLFYEDFPFKKIQDKLISDFIRMERYRRENQFDNFCLAMYQQVENIVNHLFNERAFKDYLSTNQYLFTLGKKDKRTNEFQRLYKPLNELLATSEKNPFLVNLDDWFFGNKLKAVIFCYCFNLELVGTTGTFDNLYNLGNELYQVRNLNHRGSIPSPYQQKIIDKITPLYSKYYLRFLGFLEQFVSTINNTIFKV